MLRGTIACCVGRNVVVYGCLVEETTEHRMLKLSLFAKTSLLHCAVALWFVCGRVEVVGHLRSYCGDIIEIMLGNTGSWRTTCQNYSSGTVAKHNGLAAVAASNVSCTCQNQNVHFMKSKGKSIADFE